MPKIPTVTKNLLFINVLLFLATEVLGPAMGVDLTSLLGLHFFKAPDFRTYQLVTYMFMHGGFTHILFNMFMLWMFGWRHREGMGKQEIPFLLHFLRSGRRSVPRARPIHPVCKQ